MKICGIVTEYNPFHNGHIYHIEQARKQKNCDVLIAVMSGNFVQRGEAAIINKWERVRYAIQHGVDLIVELPFPFATQSADHFAKGAIDTLALAGVDHIVFGSESNDLAKMKEIALKANGNPSLYEEKKISLAKAFQETNTALSSNDILGISYLKALMPYPIEPYTIQRTNTYHDTSLNTQICSATAIRKGIYDHEKVLHTTPMADVLDDTFQMKQYYPLIQSLLMTQSPAYLSSLFLMDEGIESLLIKHAKKDMEYETFIQNCISARYTRSRIQRTLLYLMMQITKEEMNHLPALSHIRVLGFTSKGRQYLSTLRKKDVIVASRFNQIPEPYRSMEQKACYVYGYPLSPHAKGELLKQELQQPIYQED